MKDEGWRMNDEEWRTKNEEWKNYSVLKTIKWLIKSNQKSLEETKERSLKEPNINSQGD